MIISKALHFKALSLFFCLIPKSVGCLLVVKWKDLVPRTHLLHVLDWVTSAHCRFDCTIQVQALPLNWYKIKTCITVPSNNISATIHCLEVKPAWRIRLQWPHLNENLTMQSCCRMVIFRCYSAVAMRYYSVTCCYCEVPSVSWFVSASAMAQ